MISSLPHVQIVLTLKNHVSLTDYNLTGMFPLLTCHCGKHAYRFIKTLQLLPNPGYLDATPISRS